jgi:hypothetical protein
MEALFTDVYERNLWGNNGESDYKGSSGWGSSLEFNETTYIPFLKTLIQDNGLKRIVDLGCGDFRCGPLIYNDLDVSYTGYDAYKGVIDHNGKRLPASKYTFAQLDIFNKKEEIVGGDLCILKDVLQHWALDSIYTFMDYLVASRKFKYILIVNCCDQKEDNTVVKGGEIMRPLSCDFLPLKKYSPRKLGHYQSKEISVIECADSS